jgi:hypothetical protein
MTCSFSSHMKKIYSVQAYIAREQSYTSAALALERE